MRAVNGGILLQENWLCQFSEQKSRTLLVCKIPCGGGAVVGLLHFFFLICQLLLNKQD